MHANACEVVLFDEKKTHSNRMAHSVRFIQRAPAHTRATAMTTDGVLARGEPKGSLVLPLLAVGILAFVALGSSPPPNASTPAKATPTTQQAQTQGGFYDMDGALAAALAPIAAIGVLVAVIKSDRLPKATERIAVRLLEYDLAVLFITVAYAHYVLNVEHGSAAPTEARYFDAMIRVGGFVFAWWIARRMVAGRKSIAEPPHHHQSAPVRRGD